MEIKIKITITIGKHDPVEVKVDIPDMENGEFEHKNIDATGYAKWFDESCVGWTKNLESNKMFLLHQQSFFNDRLKATGHVFLNEVYDGLGMTRTAAGQCVGWIFDADNPVGDNFIDFGLYDDCNAGFVNGTENKALLDFNVDGNILEYL